MRIHRLEIAGVGPFRDRQVIDVDALSRSGLFLIEGPTGSGKSTIVDAVSYALFGQVASRDQDPRDIRSHHCAPTDVSEVICDFSVRGRRHRIRRSPEYQRPKARGTGTTTQRATQVLEEFAPDGSVIVGLRDAKDIAVHVRTLLGMDAHQFRQLVVLPQGGFDRLLRASPRERLDVLADLIDDGILAQVQAVLRDRADDGVAARASAEEEATRARAVLTARLLEATDLLGPAEAAAPTDAPDATDDAAIDLEPIALLERVAVAAAAAGTEARERAGAAATAAGEARLARETHEQGLAIRVARADLERARAALTAEDAATADLPGALRAAEAERGRVDQALAWAAEGPERERTSRVLQQELAEAIAAEADLRSLADRLPEAAAELAGRRLEAERLAGRTEDLTRRLAAVRELHEVRDHLASCRAELTAARDAERTAIDRHLGAREAQVRAGEHLLALTRAQWQARAATLAADLRVDEPCPVCGSCEHPAPAIVDGTPPIADDSLDRAAEDERTAAEAAAQAGDAVTQSTAAVARLAEREAKLAARETELSVPDPEGLRAHLEEHLREAAEAAASIPVIVAEQDALRERGRTMSADLDACAQRQRKAREALLRHEATDAERARMLQELVGDQPIAEAAAGLARRIDALTAAMEAERRLTALLGAEAGTAMADPGAPADLDALAARAEALAATAVATATAAEESRVRAQRLSDAVAAATALAQDLARAEAHLAEVAGATDAAIALGNLASARSAANARRLTLHSYAVQRRFAAVLAAASLHLERMSNGKYSLELDEERGRGQAGLGITVLDSWTGERRDPATLSGGETFYAALSLALGLADVVREETGGADLETLIVDEGFGSLDADTLQLVLDQLDALRSRGRTVVVISHVTEMKDWVHDRLEVSIGPDRTSRVRALGGRATDADGID